MNPSIAKKPHWLNKKIDLRTCREVKALLRAGEVHTVCEESLCPNISECFNARTATVMILGPVCTRDCSFCAVRKGIPAGTDAGEPIRVRRLVEALGLRYVVVTSVTRADLAAGGSGLFVETCRELKRIEPLPAVELLIPDFQGKTRDIEAVSACGAEVVSHNLETTPSLYIKVRKGADYGRSLKVLGRLKEYNPALLTKTGLMLGLGESESEIIKVLKDLRAVSCDFLTLGQYLPPSRKHYPLQEYLPLEKFSFYAQIAYDLGFRGVQSSPYTRSSYRAHTFLSAS